MDNPELYGALTAAMAQDTVDRFAVPQPPRTALPGEAEPLRGVAGTHLRTRYPPFGFIAARELLWRLGVAEALDEHGNVTMDDAALFRSYRLTVDGNKITALVSGRASSGQFEMPPIDEALAAWLACAAYFNLVSTRREPFIPHDDLQEVMQELVRSGYLTKVDGRFRWTEKIAPAMKLYHGTNLALYGALATGIVRYAVDAFLRPKPPRTAPPGAPEALRAVAGRRFSDQAMSTFEHACRLLVGLGVAQPIDREGNAVTDDRDTGWFALTVDGDKVAALVTERASSGQFEMPPIGEVMAVWLGFGAVSTAREPFDADDDVRDLMQELAHAGYATWRGKRFLWTDKIGPAMQSSGFWDDRNRTHEEVAKLQVEAELRDAARSSPEDVRLAVLRGDVQGVREALLNRWRDAAWRPEGKPSDYYRRLATVANARRLMALVVDSSKPAEDDK